ncbi:MAG: ATP-binding protein [Lachnospiraceae bacterium]|nr:ATP-binding protein [Lachnospiraceae bacterium]
MKRALLFRFIEVLIVALAISSCIAYYFIGNQMLDENLSNMMNTIHVVDYSIDYQQDIQGQLEQIHERTLQDRNRITIIDLEGNVCADTDAYEVEKLQNHLEREEIQKALNSQEHYGYATRFSETLNEDMLYLAALSISGQYLIRMSVPYTGILDYLKSIFPFLLVGVGVAFVISMVLTFRFIGTITKPLQEISDEMSKVSGDEMDFQFKHYKYDELNVISDTTTQLTEEIRDHVNQLEFEKKIRQEFFSNASHELKTPITSIKGYAELLNQGFVKDDETKNDFMARILKETDNMTNLINDILMISRLETKEAEVTYSMVRMSPLITEIFESLEPIAAEYEVKLHQECEPLIIEASTKQLRELIVNLTSNGIKYNHPGGNVWVDVRKLSENMVVTVRDDGMGISDENQERVFERFYRVDKGRSKKMGGTGLGLSIVKHIVEYYGGSMNLISKVGEGSTFTVSIPLEREIPDNMQ